MDAHLCIYLSIYLSRWEDGEKSVQMSPDVSLPQFNVMGHRYDIISIIECISINWCGK